MSLPWFKSFADLIDHPKSQMLEDEIGVEDAWRFPHRLMCWMSRYRPDGELGSYPDSIVERNAGWRGERGVLIDAMRKVGFIDPDGAFHDWWRTQKAHVEKVQRDRNKGKPAASAKTPRAVPTDPATQTQGTPEGSARSPRGTLVLEEMRGDERRGDVKGGDSAGADAPTPDPNLGRALFKELAVVMGLPNARYGWQERDRWAVAEREGVDPDRVRLAVRALALDDWWAGRAENYDRGKPSMRARWARVLEQTEDVIASNTPVGTGPSDAERFLALQEVVHG